jgi:Ca-activated chloride channel family protein
MQTLPRWTLWLLALAAASAAHPERAAAELPAFLRTENEHVREGNSKLGAGDAKGALESYTLAARELPEAPGVQLDRGLALMKSGDLPKARESFLAATAPGAPQALRADAYQNLALAFYREGDQLSSQEKHREAQQMFRESVDAGKRSLRLRPGDANTAWNLELAARRIREEEQKQKEQDEKNKEEQQDQNKDQQPDDQQKDDSQNQDQKPQDQNQDQQQDQAKQDPPKDDPKDQPKDPQDQKQDQQKQQAQQDPQKPPEQPQDGQESPSQDQPEEGQEAQLPVEAEQALDALSDSEENFERYRARQRASRERRAPEKDW